MMWSLFLKYHFVTKNCVGSQIFTKNYNYYCEFFCKSFKTVLIFEVSPSLLALILAWENHNVVRLEPGFINDNSIKSLILKQDSDSVLYWPFSLVFSK